MKKLLIFSVIALVIFTGCVDKPDARTTRNITVKEENVTGLGWCKVGTTVMQSGSGEASYTIKGITNYKGKQVCEAEAKIAGQGAYSYTQYFTEDGKYTVMVIKDASGNVVSEKEVID